MLAYSNVSAQNEKLSTRTNIFLKESCNDVNICTLLDHIEKAQHIQKVFSKTFLCWALYIIGNQALVIIKFEFSRQVSIFCLIFPDHGSSRNPNPGYQLFAAFSSYWIILELRVLTAEDSEVGVMKVAPDWSLLGEQCSKRKTKMTRSWNMSAIFAIVT